MHQAKERRIRFDTNLGFLDRTLEPELRSTSRAA
jgi:hypothetical protein